MSFSLANPTGWAIGDLLTDVQINKLDLDHSKAVDGSAGGSYTLTAPLVFTGAKVTVPAFEVTGAASFTGASASFFGNVGIGDTSGDQCVVAATSTFNSGVTFNGNIGLDTAATATFDGTVNVNNNARLGASFSDTLLVKSTSTFDSGVTFNASIGAGSSANATFDGSVNLNGDTAINGSLTTIGNSSSDVCTIYSKVGFSGSGRILQTGIIANDADQSIDITVYRHICIPLSTTSSHTYTLTGSVQDGDWFMIKNLDTNTHTIAGLVSIPNLTVGLDVYYVRISGTWCLMSGG